MTTLYEFPDPQTPPYDFPNPHPIHYPYVQFNCKMAEIAEASCERGKDGKFKGFWDQRGLVILTIVCVDGVKYLYWLPSD